MVSHNLHENCFVIYRKWDREKLWFCFRNRFFALGVWRVHHSDYELAILFLALAAVFAFFGAVVPRFRPLNILWFWFGMKRAL